MILAVSHMSFVPAFYFLFFYKAFDAAAVPVGGVATVLRRSLLRHPDRDCLFSPHWLRKTGRLGSDFIKRSYGINRGDLSLPKTKKNHAGICGFYF